MSYYLHFIRRSTFLLFMLSLLTVSSAQEWTTRHPFPDYQQLNDFYIDEAGFGWMVGSTGEVLKTADGGLSWGVQTKVEATEGLHHIRYIPGSDGLTAIAASHREIFRTVDGGDTWAQVSLDFELGAIIQIQVISSTTLFLSDRDGRILKSNNAGATWTILLEEPAEDFVGLHFISEMTGWTSTKNGVIHQTTDGGETWNELTDLMSNTVQDLVFIDENTGYLAANSGTFLKTTDGGVTWVDNAGMGYPSNGTELLVIDENEMYVLPGGGTKMYYSEDGGANWTDKAIIDHVYNDYFKLQRMSDGKLWAIGDYQVVAYSEDNGDTWTDLYDALKGNLTFVKFIDENLGFAGGTGRYLLKTTDGGQTWDDISIEGIFTTGIAISGNGDFFNSRGYGGIYKSQNDGNTWTQILNDVGYVRSIANSPSGTLFASSAVAQFQIHRSTDNGLSWTAQDTPDGLDIRGFHFVSESKGYGWASTAIIETTDGGDTWQIVDIPFSGSVMDIYFLNADQWWILTNLAVHKTSDGGETWEEFDNPHLARAIAFKDETVGWAAGGSGSISKIFKTTDGGQSWIQEKTGDYRFNDLAISSAADENVCAIGNGGVIEYYGEELVNSVTREEVPRLAIFPNPGTDQVNLKDIPQNGMLRIYDAAGQLQHHQQLRDTNEMVNTSQLTPGLYLFHFSNGTRQWIGKWVKR